MNAIKLDLHVHSNHSSDSKLTLDEIFSAAKRRGLSGVAITDHNAIEGALKAPKVAREYGLIAIRGMEITTSKGHVLALGITEPVARRLAPSSTIEKVKALGGVAVAAHPYRMVSGMGGKTARENDFGAYETLNARSPNGENLRAKKLAEKKGRPQTGGSDSHEIASLGNAYTEFPDGLETEEQVIEALRKGDCRPGGRSVSVREIVKYYTSITGNWSRRGFKRI